MTRVLFVGQDPKTVDFKDPALPPGASPESIQEGIDFALKDMVGRGWLAEPCMVQPDEAAAMAQITAALRAADYDAVVIGGGLRIPPKSLHLFEAVVNAVHKAAPHAAIAFNTNPKDSADAAARRLKV